MQNQSNQNTNQVLNQNNQNSQINNMLNNPTQENKLQMVLFKKIMVISKQQIVQELLLSSLEGGDDFSWFVDSEGKMIDFNKKVSVFEGVKLMHNLID